MATTLIPLDGSPRAERALAYALQHLESGDEILLLRVVDLLHTYGGGYPHVAGELMEALDEEAHDYLKGLESKGRTLVKHGPAAEVILRVAEEEKVDRIVLSSHGRTGFGRWLMGSVAESVARRAPCPVWVIPGKAAEVPRSETFLIPLDGSELSDAALDYAVKKLPAKRAILLTTTNHMSGTPWTGVPGVREEIVRSLREALDERAKRLQQAGWKTECRVIDGFAPGAIIEAADEEKDAIDVILMSTHGRTGMNRFVAGSVAEMVARYSTCPVILVRPQSVLCTA